MSIRDIEDEEHDEEDALHRYICERHAFSRELLWLRAQERGDALSAGMLEREEPALRERLCNWARSIGVDVAIDDRVKRARTFHALWGRRYELIRCMWAAERTRLATTC